MFTRMFHGTSIFQSDFMTKPWRPDLNFLLVSLFCVGVINGRRVGYVGVTVGIMNQILLGGHQIFNELVPPNRTHYTEVCYGSMILWHCNMVLIFELGSILIDHFCLIASVCTRPDCSTSFRPLFGCKIDHLDHN